MKKLMFVIMFTNFSNVMFASFPVNNINEQIHNQAEIVSKYSPDIGTILFFTLVTSYLLSIFWYITRPIPKDVKERKKFFIKLLLLIFVPIVIVGILVIYSLSNMSISISPEDIYENEPS